MDDYFCTECETLIEVTEFCCGHRSLPAACPECSNDRFISAEQRDENERINQLDADRDDDRLFGLRGDWF